MVFAWWDQPHRIIGSLTRITGLPQKDREIFWECIHRQAMYDGLVAPDVGRDHAFIFWKLGYAISHQKDSVQRAATAHYHATKKYAEARQRNDLNGCCEAIFQLSEAIHYLQDSTDPTKELNELRNRISREISKYVANNLYRQKANFEQLRKERSIFKPAIDKISGGAEGIAKQMRESRAFYARRINSHFDRFGDPPLSTVNNIIKKAERDNDPTLLIQYIIDNHPALFNKVQEEIIRVFGMMWASQDRYLELFAKSMESLSNCQLIISGVLDDHYKSRGAYNLEISVNENLLFRGSAKTIFVHGLPYGKRFSNWRELNLTIPGEIERGTKIAIKFLHIGSDGSDWIAIDYMKLICGNQRYKFEIGGYQNYGADDGAAGIIYGGKSNGWAITMP
jgi:hypothetical protein